MLNLWSVGIVVPNELQNEDQINILEKATRRRLDGLTADSS
jgi:hypothetical protein